MTSEEMAEAVVVVAVEVVAVEVVAAEEVELMTEASAVT